VVGGGVSQMWVLGGLGVRGVCVLCVRGVCVLCERCVRKVLALTSALMYV
jgi:hypothetical protein